MNLLKKCRYGLTIYNNIDMWVGRSIEKYGEYSESEVQVFRDIIKQGDVVLDVGANIGCHTMAMSRLVGHGGIVFSYEPERNNFNTLAGNIAINNIRNVHVFQKAVGSVSGFISVPELDLEQTTNMGGLSLTTDYSRAPNYVVHLTTIDEQNFLKCNFIKIDVEGMEKLVLEGAKETIAKHKPVIYVEDDRDDLHDSLVGYLKSLNYIVYKHLAPLYNPENYYKNTKNEFLMPNDDGTYRTIVSSNLFCHHQDVSCPLKPTIFAMEQL